MTGDAKVVLKIVGVNKNVQQNCGKLHLNSQVTSVCVNLFSLSLFLSPARTSTKVLEYHGQVIKNKQTKKANKIETPPTTQINKKPKHQTEFEIALQVHYYNAF